MKIVEFAGMFHAGKSTIVKRLNQTLSQMGYKVQTIGKDKAVGEAFINKWAVMERQKWVLSGTIYELTELRDMSKADIILVHRGPWDAIAFLRALIKTGLVLPKEANPYIRVAELETRNIDFIVLIKLSIKASMERSWSPFPYAEMDPVVNSRVAKAMKEAYEELIEKLPEQSLVLNGHKSKEENYKLILNKLLSLMSSGEKRKNI
jgi:thymidylate kinase